MKRTRLRASSGESSFGADEKSTTTERLSEPPLMAWSRVYRDPWGVTGKRLPAAPKAVTRKGSAVAKRTSAKESGEASSRDRRR